MCSEKQVRPAQTALGRPHDRAPDLRHAARVFGAVAAGLLGSLPGAARTVFEPPDAPPRFFAMRAEEKIVVDGVLDERAWQRAPLITGFVQKDPVQQAPASYATEVKVLFDDQALYIAAVCHQPAEATRVQNLTRDFSFDDNDLFGIAIDGFLDRRDTVVFQTTPYGSQRDAEVIDGSEINPDWDARWSVRTRIEDSRWTAEIAIPWRNLRYPAGADRFGVIFARNIRSRNEQISLPAVPRALSVQHMAYEGELIGLVPPPPAVNLQMNPYAVGRNRPSSGSGRDFEAGGEAKWAVTPSTVLDFTWNTDFAQADVDRRVVNLDRFSVFFPERRQFFLEGANIFNASVTEWIRPFFSRRIGLDDFGNPIPLAAGARLTSRSSRQQLGVLAMQQEALAASPEAVFAVGRYSRNVAEQSRLGGMLTYRRDDAGESDGGGTGSHENFTYTVDGLWRPRQSFGLQAMLSLSDDETAGNGTGAQLWAFYKSDRLSLSTLQYFNRDYEPGIGLELLDTNYLMHGLVTGYDFRSRKLPGALRSISPGISAFVFRNSDDGEFLFGYAPIRPFGLRFESGARIDLHVEPNRQRLEHPFFPAGIEISPGDYDYVRYRLSAESDQSAKLGATAGVEAGNYFDGELTSYSTSLRIVPIPQIELAGNLEINRLRELGVAAERKTTRLYGATVRLALNPRLQFSGFFQRDSSTDRKIRNFRLSWEYRPLSYLYLVYNRNDTGNPAPADRLTQEQVIAKVTYLFEM